MEHRTKRSRLLHIQASLNLTVQYLRMWDGEAVVVPGTGVECETNRGKPQQSCQLSSGAAGDPHVLCTSLGLADKLEGTQMCVQLFLPFPMLCFCVLAIMRNCWFWTFRSRTWILTWRITCFPETNCTGTPPTTHPLCQSEHGEKKTTQWN